MVAKKHPNNPYLLANPNLRNTLQNATCTLLAFQNNKSWNFNNFPLQKLRKKELVALDATNHFHRLFGRASKKMNFFPSRQKAHPCIINVFLSTQQASGCLISLYNSTMSENEEWRRKGGALRLRSLNASSNEFKMKICGWNGPHSLEGAALFLPITPLEAPSILSTCYLLL